METDWGAITGQLFGFFLLAVVWVSVYYMWADWRGK